MLNLDLEAVIITLVIGSAIIGGLAGVYYLIEGRSPKKKK